MLKRDIALTLIPQGFFVTYGRAKQAKGVYKPRSAGKHGAESTANIFARGYDAVKRNRAARG